MQKNILIYISLILILNAFLCLFRAVTGPTINDRVMAVNVIGTKTLIILVLISYIYKQIFYVDTAIVYALLNFIIAIAASRYIETRSI